ncbi:MAG: DUF3108 domain-containing protein [Pseudomonadota bacterium]|jgi:hypothetical protein|nr:MAG: hypothetical protein DIU57_04760 [Pseudomonadota bacterium]
MRTPLARRLLRVSPISSAVFGLVMLLLCAPAAVADPSTPSKVSARYKIYFNGIEIGSFQFESNSDSAKYSLAGRAKLSALLGILKWSGALRSEGTLARGEPLPSDYFFRYKSSSDSGSVTMSFDKRRVAETKLEPPPSPSKSRVPLTEEHLKDVFDPMSAVLAMTTGGLDNPCERKVAVFDGKQRFDIVLTFRRKESIKEAQPSGEPAVAFVCGVRYIPIAGHKKNNRMVRSLAASEDIEVALRPVPSANILVPYEISIPTIAGPAVLKSQRVEILTGMKQIALVH